MRISIRKSDMKKKDSVKGGYLVHDNGARPFKVLIKGSTAEIYSSSDDENYDFFKSVPFKKKFIGKDVVEGFIGNSILLDLGSGTYMYIGDRIYTFKVPTGDNITKYESPVGNSDVPYPVAIGSKNVYFMLDAVSVPKSLVPGHVLRGGDSYGYFYDLNLKKKSKKMTGFKLVHKRI